MSQSSESQSGLESSESQSSGSHSSGSQALPAQDAGQILDRQAHILELIAAATPLPQVLTEILTSLERMMPGARCSVLLLDREQRTLHHGAAPSLPGAYVAAIDGMPIGDSAGSCGTAASRNTAIVAVDVRTDPRWHDYRHLAEAAGLRSCWSTPIEGGDGLPVGTFAVYHDAPHQPTWREQQIVDRFTHLASVAIDHAGLIGDLTASEERFRRSFDDNALGMAILGPDRRILRSNTALGVLSGWGKRLVGRPLATVLTPRYGTLDSQLDEVDGDGVAPVAFEAVLHGATPDAGAVHDAGVAARQTEAIQTELAQAELAPTEVTQTGSVQVEVTVSLLHGQLGAPAQYVVNVVDLTERRAAERHRRARLEAETARRTAEQLSRAKSDLLAAVGHEARTPMQAIVGFAELLGSLDLDNARRAEALEHISAAAGHVMDLLTDVLDLSRLEAGVLPLAQEAVPAAELTCEVLGVLSRAAELREVELHQELGEDVVWADRRRLRQVLLNLVGNAITHGRRGGSVVVRSHPTPAPGWVVLSVDDDGPGIPAAVMPRLFTPFGTMPTRTSTVSPAGPAVPSAGAEQESVGLGLGLAHGLAQAMGGDLRVAASSARGTSMLLRLPRSLPPERVTAPEPSTR